MIDAIAFSFCFVGAIVLVFMTIGCFVNGLILQGVIALCGVFLLGFIADLMVKNL